MQNERDVLLIDESVQVESDRPRPLLQGWARAAAVVGGAALGLAGFAGVGYAATPDAHAVNGLGLDRMDGPDLMALPYGGPDDREVLKDDSPKSARSPKTAKSPKTATSPQSVQSPATTNTVSPQTVSPQTGTSNTASPQTVSPNTVSPQTVSPNTVSPQTVTPSPISVGDLEQNSGLHLGQLFHDGQLPESVAAELAAALRLAPEDFQQMTLGELLHTAHAAGLSTHDVADILDPS